MISEGRDEFAGRGIWVPSFSRPEIAAIWGSYGAEQGRALSRVGWAQYTACWGSGHTCTCKCSGCGESREQLSCHTRRLAAGKPFYHLEGDGNKPETQVAAGGWAMATPGCSVVQLSSPILSPFLTSCRSPHPRGCWLLLPIKDCIGAGLPAPGHKAKSFLPFQPHSQGLSPLLPEASQPLTFLLPGLYQPSCM